MYKNMRTFATCFVVFFFCGFMKIEGNGLVGTVEYPGGILKDGQHTIARSKTPYWIRNDIIIDRNAELTIQPGVELRFDPMVGITVRGVLNAVGTESEKITFTSAQESPISNLNLLDIRLVDGPNILSGRVQLYHRGAWRNVCTNSRNWTTSDMETACRQLGFQGGTFYNWFNRQMPLKPRLLYESPKCTGTERSLFDCQWGSRQLGSGVCDYHPDLGIECLPRHDQTSPFWRGLRFEHAAFDKILTLQNTMYVSTSRSKLAHLNIRYAGNGRNSNATSALHIEGIPPIMQGLDVSYSAYNGINITSPESPVLIRNSTIRSNRGYGIFINSTYGLSNIRDCSIFENGGDGIKYVHQEDRPDEKDRTDLSDFCMLALTQSTTYPIQVYADQTAFPGVEKHCSQKFRAKPGHVLTLSFIRSETDRNNSANIEVYDGTSENDKLLTIVSIRNNTRPQSVTSTNNRIFIKFFASARTKMSTYMRITSGLGKTYDLKINHTLISNNNGRGVAFENLRSQLWIHNSSISDNNHVAGVHVVSGAGDINITESRISFNDGDGVNITYTGGNRNISRTSISSNKGYGITVWLNDTKETEYIYHNQTTVVQYSVIMRNNETGILHGNYCGEFFVNITGNSFDNSLSDALEIMSCWKISNTLTNLQIGHNLFQSNERIGIKISPALNILGKIEFNNFKHGSYGAIFIKNKPLEEFNVLKTSLIIQQNYFRNNSGVFVVNIGLSPYSENQKLLFTLNFVKNNFIKEPFQSDDGLVSRLVPRTRVAAPVVVSSNNVDIFRNILDNKHSTYEIGSHFEDQSKIINCTYNWLGFVEEAKVFERIFHRNDRYNLAKISYIPYLLHSSSPTSAVIHPYQNYIPKFNKDETNLVGGEIEGQEILVSGEYIVERDINIRPGGKLTIEPGVTLNFPPSIGIMVGGKLEAKGISPNNIRFTLKQEMKVTPEDTDDLNADNTEKYNSDVELIERIPIRLLGGNTTNEGRLQVRINEEWGTVCNYGWDILDAALVCHQLGLVLNPDDWYLERNQIPDAGISENVILTNVQCDEHDTDITKCKADRMKQFENSCTHEHDVGVKCHESSWAGVRFSVLAERFDLQFVTIEKSGLLDYSTNRFKPALQIDFARQSLEQVRIVDNFYDGIGVIYSDIYSADAINLIKNSEVSNNKGSGISFKQLGMKIQGSTIENNADSGIRHNSMLSALQQREISGWFKSYEYGMSYRPILIPQNEEYIGLDQGETKYLVTSRVTGENIKRRYVIKCPTSYVIGIQLLNPIENRSTETILIQDSQTVNNRSDRWYVNRDINVFPTTSSSYGIILFYESGTNALGGAVLVISSVIAPIQNIKNRIVKGPVPTLTLKNTRIRRNKYGLQASYYNRYINELGDHFLRKANETIKIINCDISHNHEDAIYINSPQWDVYVSNISEITLMINDTLITDNGEGIRHFSRDLRNSNNLFHYVLQDNTIERNAAGGFDINLPYVWQYDENFTHSIFFDNNTWRNNRNFGVVIDGHFSIVNVTKNLFTNNICKHAVFSIRGMEKKLKIEHNKMLNNIGKYVVEFSSNSQSEILGDVFAKFTFNEIRNNRYLITQNRGLGILQVNKLEPTSVIKFSGIQKVKVNRNLLSDNVLDYQLIAGIRTARINNLLDVKYNWWGSSDEKLIEKVIFDFEDWNSYAVATFIPFLTEDAFDSSYSISYDRTRATDLDNLGGRLTEDLVLNYRNRPYIVRSDITIMPNVTLTIMPNVEIEFAPNVGILVLGTLKAQGRRYYEIKMRPLSRSGSLEDNKIIKRSAEYEHTSEKRAIENMMTQENVRLCEGADCLAASEKMPNEGFLEYFNRTTLQWIPMCDSRFTERNAQVVCRQLGFDPLNVFFDYDIRVEYHSNSLSRIWSWPEPLQCSGSESNYDECPIRLNGQLYGHRHECKWNSKFVFINCGDENHSKVDYWGGIRFAHGEFEQHLYEHRIHDAITHESARQEDSELEFVHILGAGILHNEKSPAVQAIVKSPKIRFVNISMSASHGINLISPSKNVELLFNTVEDSLGVGINTLSLTGEGREAAESSFTPLKNLNIPYNLFSLIDICDTSKIIVIEERVLLYYKYDNYPVNCVKIFKSVYNIKPLGFRLLQFNLFNTTNRPGKPDVITLYDGDIYNVSSTLLATIESDSKLEKKLFKTKEPSLSVNFFTNGASANHGFIAEIVTLPISAISINRDIQHNISHSVVKYNKEGALTYVSAGEVNPIITLDKNQFIGNCEKLYGNFTSCPAAIHFDIQNTQTLYFRNNLVKSNQGGLSIKADSGGSATSLKGWIHNNLFVKNANLPAIYIEGRQSSPYQEVTIYRNYFTQNYARYEDTIVLKQVVSNFTLNYVKNNKGLNILEVSGFDKVRLPIYQTTSHNGFYKNYALHPDSRSTVVAGTAGQHYIHNIFFNPDNDYEMITVNRSMFTFNSTSDIWKTKIDAAYNYWGYNETLPVSARIRDMSDDLNLLEVTYIPYYMDNQTILDGKCPPGWDLVGDTCYIYIGAPMSFEEAREFCRSDNASMPYVMNNYHRLYQFIRKQQQWYQYMDRVWVQDIDRINQCTVFVYQTIEVDNCHQRNSFLCEIDPKVTIDPLSWRGDIVITAVIGTAALAIIIILLIIGCWYSKSKYRHVQRMERRNSIRQSLNSLRSVGTNGFSELGYRRKPGQMSTRSTDTLTKGSDYKKMMTNGSIDSMEKSTYNSSIEDNQSYDIYEAHNPNPVGYNTYGSSTHEFLNPVPKADAFGQKAQAQPQAQYMAAGTFGLAYKNEGFRDNSTFTSRNPSTFPSRAESVQDDNNMSEEAPIIHSTNDAHDDTYTTSDYYNTDTLPLNGGSRQSDSTLEFKRELDEATSFEDSYDPARPGANFLLELKSRMPQQLRSAGLPTPPEPPRARVEPAAYPLYVPDYNTLGIIAPPSAHHVLETNLDATPEDTPRRMPKSRSKSEALLETNFDYMEPEQAELSNQPLSERSKSQPLETAIYYFQPTNYLNGPGVRGRDSLTNTL